MSSKLFRHQCELGAQWAIGATRCDDKCVNTVFLETQGPCGSARRCGDVTVTHDTKCTGESSTGHEGVQKLWHKQKELKEMKRFRNDEGVLQTMVKDVVQDGAGPTKKERRRSK